MYIYIYIEREGLARVSEAEVWSCGHECWRDYDLVRSDGELAL